jgi:hypothetical protein
MARKQRSRKQRSRRRTRGAGYGVMPGSMIAPGIASVMKYTGMGVDTPATPKPLSQGLPGLSGGSRRRRTRGAGYGFPKSPDMLMSNPFESTGCRGAPVMRGGASLSPAYFSATAGYSTAPELVPGAAAGGFLRTVAYPDRVPTPACGMKGGSRTRRNSRKRKASRKQRKTRRS